MKKIIIVVGVVVVILAIAFVGLRIYTKQFSPHDLATYESEESTITVSYSRPYKKERDIFGDLVPYNEVWRTGANEAAVFTTSAPLLIAGENLSPGSYSLFTIPGKDSWQIILNSETAMWGVELTTGKANREPANDVLKVEVKALATPDVFEQFTISFEEMGEEIEMILMWDQTLVVVPIEIQD